ncbi:MAG: methyltransferase domain-containing protein [Phycisphaeraceae bacterium]|nr:methyltransferase domain-containing protein [Phycisphaeraceae bacterium]
MAGRHGPKVTPFRQRGTTFRKPVLRLFTTTLWEFPSQHYLDYEETPGGSVVRTKALAGVQGDPKYEGATPSWVIWQLLQRYTAPGESVLDPMCGSGTMLDVAADLGRVGIGFDLAPGRADIRRADARRLPLAGASVDFVFVDPPYSTHLRYSDDPACIGRLDAGGKDGGRAYYDAMRQVFAEMHRVLRPGRHAAVYVSDSCSDGRLQPIGAELFATLECRFEPIDWVCVVRHSATLSHGGRASAVLRTGLLQRGFNHLLIVRKATRSLSTQPRARKPRTR